MTYDDLMQSILTAREQMLKHCIEANSVTLNGRKYGKLIENLPPNMKPTIFGMAVKADYALPDDYDFLVQYEPPQPIVLDREKALKFEMDDEEVQEQVIKDAKKYGIADLMKPKRGEWIAEVPSSPSAGYLKLQCSECKAEYTFIAGTGFFFCPNCGSEMRGVDFGN